MTLQGPRRWKSKKRPRWDEATLLHFRFVALRGAIVLLFVILLAQLWRLQVVESRTFQLRAEHNRLRVDTISPPRGVIYDRNGVQLVSNIPSFAVVLVPADLPPSRDERRSLFRELAQMLRMELWRIQEEVEAREAQRDLYTPLTIQTNVPRELAFAVAENSYRLPGVHVQIEATRGYPYGPLISHILGYVGRISAEEYATLQERGYELNDRVGKTGVEATFESMLRGVPGRETIETTAEGKKVRSLGIVPPRPGANLHLTIDLDLQKKMAEVMEKSMGPSRHAAAMALNPKSGEVLGMVSIPSYDNNLFSRPLSGDDLQRLLEDPRRPLLNHAIGGAFPPGSSFKVVTGAAALQEGVASAATQIVSAGQIAVASQYDPSTVYVFKDWAALGLLDFNRAIALSSDVYFYHLAGGYQNFTGLGIERLAHYTRAFGLGQRSGIALPGETTGLVPDPQWKREQWKEIWLLGDTYHFGIGQGFMMATPLQMANVVASIANGGTLWKPQVVREVVSAEGQVVRPFAREAIRALPVHPGHLATIRRGMRDAVATGTATTAQVPGVQVAGKTGTAEFGQQDPRTGAYTTTHGWFISFAPYDDPEIALVVFHEQGQGALTAAPAAKEILRHYFTRPRPDTPSRAQGSPVAPGGAG